MYLLKISLLLFSFALHTHTSYAEKSRRRQYNTRNFGLLSNDNGRCLCPPKGHLPTVNQILDPNNNGQERVVIYLYKNDNSNEIKMYTPNPDKQALIPDITYDSGDTLVDVIPENIATLFHSSPRIKVYNHRYEKLRPRVTESLPIGLNVGTIENVYPKDENILRPNHNGYSVNEYEIEVQLNEDSGSTVARPYTKNINKVIGNEITNKWPILEGETGYVNSETIGQQWWHQNTKNPFRYSQAFSEKRYPNIDGDESGYIFDTKESNAFSPGSQSLSNLEESINPISRGYVTFNVWFTRQINRFNNIHLPQDIKSINYNVLRTLVRKTLLENNLEIGSDGVIRDSKGLVIDAANLELRPMLIGETIDHQILDHTLTTILPKHKPFLEGILITLVYPPRILGIIPLGKTYLQQTYESGSTDQLDFMNSSKMYLNDWNADSESYWSQRIKTEIPYSINHKKSYLDANWETLSTYSHSNTNAEPSHSYDTNIQLVPSYSYVKTAEPVSSNSYVSNVEPASSYSYDTKVDPTYSYAYANKVDPISSYTYSTSEEPASSYSYHTNVQPAFSYSYDESIEPASYTYGTNVDPISSYSYSTSEDPAVSYSYHTSVLPASSYLYGENTKPASYSYDTDVEVVSSYSYTNVNNEPSYSNSANTGTYWDVNRKPLGKAEGTYWSNGPSTTIYNEPYQAANMDTLGLIQPIGDRRKMSSTIIKHYLEAPKLKNKKIGREEENFSSEVTAIDPLINDYNTTESGRSFPRPSLKGVMKTLMYLLNDSPSGRVNALASNSTDVDIVNESENMNSGEHPDFRIIGGNAATGSGTPLSNKGRSGYYENV